MSDLAPSDLSVEQVASLLTRFHHLGFPEWEAEVNTGVTEFVAWEFVGYKPDGESFIEDRLSAETAANLYKAFEGVSAWMTDVVKGSKPEGGE